MAEIASFNRVGNAPRVDRRSSAKTRGAFHAVKRMCVNFGRLRYIVMLRHWIFGFGCLIPVMSVAADNPATVLGAETMPASREIRLDDCRIVLIQHVTLACDRSGIVKAVEFKEGQQVLAKQHVALIADEVARANLAVAEKKARNDVDERFARKASQLAEVELKRSLAANKTPLMSPSLLKDRPIAQYRFGQAEATVRAARAYLMEAMNDVEDELRAGREVPSADATQNARLACVFAANATLEAVDLVHNAAGTTAMRMDSPLERKLRDAHACANHRWVAHPR